MCFLLLFIFGLPSIVDYLYICCIILVCTRLYLLLYITTYDFLMNPGRAEVNYFTQTRSILEAKFGEGPLCLFC